MTGVLTQVAEKSHRARPWKSEVENQVKNITTSGSYFARKAGALCTKVFCVCDAETYFFILTLILESAPRQNTIVTVLELMCTYGGKIDTL